MKAAITESPENYSETPKLQCNLQNKDLTTRIRCFPEMLLKDQKPPSCCKTKVKKGIQQEHFSVVA